MGNSIIDPVKKFDSVFTNQFQEEMARLVVNSYASAADRCQQEFENSESHDVLGQFRRGKIEGAWRTLAVRLGYSATVKSTDRGTANHTQIEGNDIIMVQCCVLTPSSFVRHADHRLTLARSCNYLFPEFAPPEGGKLLAILVHGPGKAGIRKPDFADIVFPLHDEMAYAEQRIKLFDRFPAVLQSTASFHEEIVVDDLVPELLLGEARKAVGE